MITKTKLTKVYISDKKKDGTKLIDKNGKQYHKIAIKIADEQYRDEYLSGFLYDDDDPRFQWKEGDEVTIVIERNGEYVNFKVPSRLDMIEERVSAIEARMDEIEGNVYEEEVRSSVVSPDDESPF